MVPLQVSDTKAFPLPVALILLLTNVLPLLNSAIVEYVLRLYSSRLLKRRLHDSMMTGEMKVSGWLRRYPSAMHSQLGVSPTTFRLVLRRHSPVILSSSLLHAILRLGSRLRWCLLRLSWGLSGPWHARELNTASGTNNTMSKYDNQRHLASY